MALHDDEYRACFPLVPASGGTVAFDQKLIRRCFHSFFRFTPFGLIRSVRQNCIRVRYIIYFARILQTDLQSGVTNAACRSRRVRRRNRPEAAIRTRARTPVTGAYEIRVEHRRGGQARPQLATVDSRRPLVDSSLLNVADATRGTRRIVGVCRFSVKGRGVCAGRVTACKCAVP